MKFNCHAGGLLFSWAWIIIESVSALTQRIQTISERISHRSVTITDLPPPLRQINRKLIQSDFTYSVRTLFWQCINSKYVSYKVSLSKFAKQYFISIDFYSLIFFFIYRRKKINFDFQFIISIYVVYFFKKYESNIFSCQYLTINNL